MPKKRRTKRFHSRTQPEKHSEISGRARRRANRVLAVFAAFSAVLLGIVIWHIVDDVVLDLVVYSSNSSSRRANAWVEELRSNGFHVHLVEARVEDLCPRLHIPRQFAAEVCAITENPARYVLSGYVPAHAISRMLRDKPDFDGLVAPDPHTSTEGSGADPELRQPIWGFWADGHHVLYAGSEG